MHQTIRRGGLYGEYGAIGIQSNSINHIILSNAFDDESRSLLG